MVTIRKNDDFYIKEVYNTSCDVMGFYEKSGLISSLTSPFVLDIQLYNSNEYNSCFMARIWLTNPNNEGLNLMLCSFELEFLKDIEEEEEAKKMALTFFNNVIMCFGLSDCPYNISFEVSNR